jgi:phosphoribosylaminoimidazole-succinocarboxamide synthase
VRRHPRPAEAPKAAGVPERTAFVSSAELQGDFSGGEAIPADNRVRADGRDGSCRRSDVARHRQIHMLSPLMSRAVFEKALQLPLESTDFKELGQLYRGKVRDNYSGADGVRTIIVSDRISAFDCNVGTLPLKGQMLNHIAAWWFERTKHLADNHVISVPDPNAMRVHECTPLPVEMVVRGYLTGTTSTSIWAHYEKGARTFCGHALADGMQRHQKLPKPLLTPSTKAAHGDHDVSASREEILKLTGMSAKDFDVAGEMAMKVFAFGQSVSAERGLILVDTKYEFGKTRDGRIVLIDEIHTPDSSRYWLMESYEERFRAGQNPESFDKDNVRRYLAEQGFKGDGPVPHVPDEVRITASEKYLGAIETLTGQPFQPNLEPAVPRLRKNLGLLA